MIGSVRFTRTFFAAALLTCAGGLSACGALLPAGAQASVVEAAPLPSETPTGLPTPIADIPLAAATPEPASPPSAEPQELLPSPTPDVLRIIFPTPGQPGSSAWRPPLYEVPWAVGQYDHFYFDRPIAADEINWPVWDYRYGGIFPDTDIVHTGIDIPAPIGTSVMATGSGKVVWTGYGLFSGALNPKDPYGLAIAVRHDFGYLGQRLYTVYAHLSEITVYNGQVVESGDQLGLSGDTGKTTGPHLHYEVRLSDNRFFDTRNPELWLAPPQGWGVLVGRVLDTRGEPVRHQEVRVTSVDSGTYWLVRTYGPTAVNPDPFYNENLVLSDLPAGRYRIRIEFNGGRFDQEIVINPGQVSYFTFFGKNLYNLDPPPTLTPPEIP